MPQFAENDLDNRDNEWGLAIRKCVNKLATLDAELKESADGFKLPERTKNFLIPKEKEKEELKKLNIYKKQLEEIKNKIYLLSRNSNIRMAEIETYILLHRRKLRKNMQKNFFKTGFY